MPVHIRIDPPGAVSADTIAALREMLEPDGPCNLDVHFAQYGCFCSVSSPRCRGALTMAIPSYEKESIAQVIAGMVSVWLRDLRSGTA